METQSGVRVSVGLKLVEPGEPFDRQMQKGYGTRAKLTTLRVRRVTVERYTAWDGARIETVYWVSGTWYKADETVGEQRHKTTVDRDVLPSKLANRLDALAVKAVRDFAETPAVVS